MPPEVVQGFPLSAQQVRGWTFHRRARALGAHVLVTIAGELDPPALDRAVQAVVERHEILRTTFESLAGMSWPVQVVAPPARQAVTYVDAPGLPPDRERRLVERLLPAKAPAPRDLARGPLMRCAVVRWSAARHALAITLPSLCADHRTLGNLVAEIAAGYAAAAGAAGRGRDVDPEPLQYADFVEWQRSTPATDGPASERFWQVQKAGAGPVDVPFAAPDETTPFIPAAVARVMTEPGVRRLRAVTSRYRTSEAAFWMACWSFVLWRLTGRTDLVVGRVFQGRRYPELRSAMGVLARCLPIRCRGSWQTSFADHMDELHRTMIDADGWHDGYDVLPAAGAADAGAAPEWPLMFAAYESPAAHRAGALRFITERQVCHDEPFLLKLTCFCGDREARTELHADAGRVPRRAAAWLLDGLHQLAEAAVADPERPLATLDLLSPAQRRSLAEPNGTSVARPHGDRPLTWHVEAQVARTPDAIAVAGPAGGLTYAGLWRWAGHLAHELRARGVATESRVAILLRRSPRLVAAVLGVLEAGGAYVPLEPTDPDERIAACLEDAGITVGVADAGVDVSAWPHVDWMTIADAPPATAALEGAALPAVSGDHLAYVIYTSGSTGTPKGTLIPHAGLMNYLLWCVGAYGITAGEAAPLHSSPAFDLTVTAMFAPLLVGGVVTIPPDVAAVEALASVLEQPGPSGIVKLTPSHLQALAWQVPPSLVARRARLVVVGGEALHAGTLSPWRAASPELRIVNEYGPTETVVGSCAYEVPGGVPGAGPVPIGRPIANTRVYVLDRSGDPVAPGADGELFIGGIGLARGYLNRPGLTAERFVPDAFGGDPGGRLYRTGDRVRWNADRQLVYVGRLDHQVKLRGNRVELGEVEAALRALPHVRAAAAAVRHGPRDVTQLVAYLAGDPPARPSLDEVRLALRRTRPDYMLPDAVVWLDALPLTRSGKVDRRALPAAAPAVDGNRRIVRPSTGVEEVLAAIWADVLRLDEVGVEDNFFALGGDSIRAIQVRARARERGLDITHEQIFEHQTIAALAATTTFGVQPARFPPLEPFALVADGDRERLPADLDDAYPLAALQAGMVFHSEYADGSAVFHDIHSFTLRGEPEVEVLRQALGDMARRHAILRTAFELARYSRPLQIVYRQVAPPFETTDFRDSGRDDARRRVDAWLDEERRRPFDWRTPPLVRFHVHLLGEGAFQFTMSFHHAMLDGWSAASLLTELFNRYQALLERRDAEPEAPLQCSYRDFIALEQQAEASASCRAFWNDALRGASPARLAAPAAGSRERAPAARVGTMHVPLPAEVVDGLRRLSRAAALPLKSVALAAHAKVLAVEAGQDRILTGLVANGRPEEVDGDRVLGLFLNTVPCVVPVGACRWRDLAHTAFECERRLLPFRLYPLARLQREHGDGALFDVAFNFMHYHVYQDVQSAAPVQVDGYWGYEETDVPLMANFYLDLQGGGLGLLLGYHPEAFSRDDVERIARRYGAVLGAMAADPDANHLATDLLSPAEREQIVRGWPPRTSEPWRATDDRSIVAGLDACAAAKPDAIAVTCGPASVSYGELHARAAAVARCLRARGIGADTPVAVCLDRSPELIVALLGILKAGGAYVPLDPAYPEARLALVLEDARPAAIVSRASLGTRIPADAVPVIRVDADWPAIESTPAPAPAPGVLAGNLAYVMYTSGSTGRPKGVMIPHGAVLNFALAMDREVGPVAGAVWLAVTSVSFDISVLELIWTLARGARVVIASAPEEAAGLMRDEGVTHLQCTPSWAWRLLASDAEEAPRALGRLSHLLVGGEALPQNLAGALRTHAAGRISNMYGPTETTIWSSSDAIADAGAVSIGVPVLNTQIVVLDPHGHLVPPGRPGEICIGGDGVARGYVARPDLTAERFRPDAHGGAAGARLYRTGDRGRLLADGRLQYGGRRDGQVKLRGHRIELSEVEAALRRQEGVRDAVAVLREDVPGERRLVGYVVSAGDARPASDAIQAALRRLLPEPMVPSLIVPIDALPLTPNGKVDRRRLPAPAGGRPALAEPYAAPRTDMEIVLARVWAEVLRVDRVGIHDSFFALGGHSLSATQVVARLRDALGIELQLRRLFEAPTIARLASWIEHESGRHGPSLAEPPLAGTQDDATPDLDALIEQLERLPADEVQELLDGTRRR